jgi:hypothetical protein
VSGENVVFQGFKFGSGGVFYLRFQAHEISSKVLVLVQVLVQVVLQNGLYLLLLGVSSVIRSFSPLRIARYLFWNSVNFIYDPHLIRV